MALKLYDKLKHTVRFWLLRTLPTCQQTVETISQSMERRLTVRERLKLKVHFWICVWCQWYMENLQLIRQTSRGQTGEASSATLSNEARERIRRRLTNQN